MKDKGKTREKLINGLTVLRRRTAELEKRLRDVNKQFRESDKASARVEKELKNVGMEMAIGLSEVFEALKKIATGDPRIRISEKSTVELISKLKRVVNMTAANIGQMVDQCHEFAICLCEHFDVLKRVSGGDLNARVTGESGVELLEILKDLTNETIENISAAREDIKRLRRHHELILKSAGEGILGLDIKGDHTFVNPAAAKMLGYDVKELLGQHSHTMWHHTKTDGSPYPEEECPIYGAYKDGAVHYVTEEIFWRKDGSSFPVECTSTPILEKGNLVGAVVNFRDISERRKADEALRTSEEKYRRLVENALVGIYKTNLQGDFIYVNEALSKIYEFETPEELMATSDIPRYKNRGVREIFIENLRKTGKVRNFEIEVSTRTGRTKHVLVDAVLEGDVLSGMVLDVTEHKRADERIRSQLQRFAALRDIDRAITASLDARVTLKVVLEEVTRQLQVDAANVLLFKPHMKRLEYATGLGFRTAALRHTSLKLGEGYAGLAAFERRIINIPDLSKDAGDLVRAPLLKAEGFVSYFAAPLVAKGQVKGVLEIFHRSPLDPDGEWLDFLESLAVQAAIAIDNAELFNDLQRSNIDLTLAYDATIEGWSSALDMRDKETEGHSQRVTETTVRIAESMGIRDAELVHVRRGALLHDIGKMGIPDSILLKEGKLTEEELEIMHKHPMFAYRMISEITFLRPALDIPYCHHEKWDGTGYPRGLKGKQIPLAARIFAVVDVWDALCSDRSYRPAWSKDRAREYLKEQAGVHFDPKVVEVFLKMEPGR
jgi:PAS domain S-box-containing protein